MDDAFELIDLKSGNVASDYDRRDEALAALGAVADTFGWPAIASFSLMQIRGEDQTLVAKQDDLVQLVRQSQRKGSPVVGNRQSFRSQGYSLHVPAHALMITVRHNKVRAGHGASSRGVSTHRLTSAG